MAGGFGNNDATLFVSNLESRVTEEHLWELFLQAGPMRTVKIPRDKASGKNKSFGFVTFRDDCSVPYACELMNGLRLFKKAIMCKPQRDSKHDNKTPNRNNIQTPQMPRPLPPLPDWARSPNDSVDSFGTPSPGGVRGGHHRDSYDRRGSQDSFDSRGFSAESSRSRHDREYDNRRGDDRRGSGSMNGFFGQRPDNYAERNRGQWGDNTHYDPRSDGGGRHSPRHMNSPSHEAQSPLFMQVVNQTMHNFRRGDSSDHDMGGSNYGPIRNDNAKHKQHRDSRRQSSRPY